MIIVVNKRYFTGKGIYIGRGSPLGNPYSSKPSKYPVRRCKTPEESVQKFEQHLRKSIDIRDVAICTVLNEIWKQVKANQKVHLVCFCKDKDGNGVCHGDIIKKVVEEKL